MKTHEAGSHQSTYQAIFQHPVARNLKWVEVRAMLVSLADKVDEHGDVLKVTRNGRTLVMHRPSRSGMDNIAELMKVRHFLTESGENQQRATEPTRVGKDFLIVLDHREARVYQTGMHGAVPQHIAPLDPTGSGRYLHNVSNDSNGQRRPEPGDYYEAIARAIKGAERILLFGSGTGASSAMDHFVSEIKKHHAPLAQRVIGAIAIDWQHLTEDQLLAKARDAYAAVPSVSMTPVAAATTVAAV